MKTLSRKVAVITGGSSGIGLASAQLFAEHGARVAITGRREDALKDALARIDGEAISILGDVADIQHHQKVADEVEKAFGKIDIYLANAGVNTIRHHSSVDEEEYDAQFAVNTKGIFFGVQKIVPVMRDGGAIILTGSIASDHVLDGHGVYAGTKAAIGAFARSWALELKDRGIRVNVLSPGPVDTPILEKLGVPAHEMDGLRQQVAAAIPLGRLGTSNELARAALFLASDASSFVTGINLRVDGGMSLL